ncbi:hypothetical protein V8V91_15135 [Algoriphagus halophilus]|uniref:hypothetical protein n=1 Tax=Algoriphagus halophilus TaxID=226505 RepID=UPI00358E2A83
MSHKSSKTGNLNRREFLKSSSGIVLFIGASGIFPALVSCTDTKKSKSNLKNMPLLHG